MPSSGVTCMCAPGYANSKEGQLCGACAEGFEGYPNCKRLASEEFKEREDEAGGAVDGCSLPALPRDLNGRGMLESDAQSSLHLQGDYWLDVRSRRHIMHVAISRPSVLHLRVDLGALAGALGVAVAIERLASSGGSPQADMQLPIKGADDSSKAGGNRGSLVWQSLASVEDGGRMASGEGFLEAVLLPMKSNGPNPSSSAIASSLRYRIILAYEVLGELHTDKEDALCRSLGLQLGITPLDELKKLASQVDVTCPSNVAGRIDIPEHYDVSPTGWSKNGTFYIATAEPGTRVMRKGKAIQPISIRIPEVAGKVARLSAVVGYRFEMSSVGLLLEAERPDVSGARDKPRCEAMVKPNKGEDKKDWGAESIIHGSGEAKTQSNGAAKKDEWADWNNIGKKTGYGEPSKAYYGNEPRERAQGRTGNAFADDDEDDDDDDRKSEGKRHSADRDGAYDFHDLINSALSGLAQGGHGGPGHLTGGFPGLGSLPGGVHVIHMPFSHGAGRGGAAGGGGSFVGGDPDADVNQIPKHIADMFKNHPFPGAWGDDDEDDDTDDLDDDDDDDDDDDWGNRRRRALLSIYDGGGSVVASSTPAASDVLVERSEEDEAPAGKISVATMLRKPVAGSEEMFDCRSGRERYNHNVIDESLPPGTYTLWLVRDSDFDEVLRGRADDASAEGDEVNMRCLAFDLAMSVTFEDPPPTPVTCTARTLPAALHEPGFLGPTGTRVHIQDTFYMRQARLSRRHFIDFTVRGQGPSVLRAHVESLESVDIRLSVFKLERTAGSDKSKATIVDVETPHVVGGLRGDAILSLLPPGSYKLQLEFLNPGGAPGFPKWDLGEASNGQGRQGGGRDGCEVLDLEIALSPLEDLGSDGWKQDCPGKGNGVDRVPSLQDMTGGRQTALHIGDSFNVPAADGGSAPGESMLQRLREDREPLFWAQTRNGSRGYVIASYPLEVEALAVLRAGLRSDFVHDDLVLDVVDAAGRLVFTGAHRRSYNHIQSLLQPGRYTVKLRQSMSAAEVLASKTNDKWIQKTDAKGKTYFFNTVSQTSQWHRPPVMAGSDCARFSFWIALDPFAAADDCHVAADAMSVPASLDGPGMLGSHNRAYLQGVFSIGGQQGLAPTSEGNSMSQTIRFTVTRPSRIRAVVVPLPDELGNSVLTELTLHSIAPLTEKEENEGVAKLVEQVARGEFLSSSSYEHDKYDEASASQGTQGISLGSRQILTAVISPEDEHESAEKQQQRQQDGGAVSAPRHFVLRLRHMLPPVQDFKCTKFSLLISVEPIPEAADPDAAAEGDDGSSCAGVTESKWPQISEDLTGLFACQDSSGDANFKCWQDLHGMRVMQSSKPARNRFAINLDKTSHLRIEIGFPLYSAPLLASIVPLGCPDGAGPCASSGAEGKDEIAPLVSADRPGSSLLVARWLPRGRYLVTLAQAARKIGADDPDADDGNVEGAGAGAGKARTVCERFSFRMVLEKASGASASENHLGQHVQRLPLSLDGVPFLKFGGKAHLWGRYAMAHPGLATQEMFFSLKKESMIRIDAMPQLGAGHVSLAVFRLGDLGEGKLGASPATELSPLNAELPPALQRADVLVQAKEGRYKVVVAFEPSDWSLHPPSRGRVRGSFTMQLAINPTQQSSLDSESVDSNAGESTCEDSALEARQGDGPFHLFAAHGSFSNKDRRGSLIKVVPLTTRQESVVRVTVQADFASAALYTVLSPSPASSGSSKDTRKSTGAKSSWVCKPGYNSCQLDAVVAAGEYTLAFYQPSAQSSDAKPAAATCVKFSLRIQMHPTSLKYGMGCHGARQVPADLSPLAVTDTTRDSSGKSKYRAALTWAHAALLVSEADAGQVQVKDTMLVSLPASFAKDSYLLHVRHRDARPHSQIEVTPFTSFAATGMSRSEGAEAPQSGVSVIHQGEEGGWETLFKTSHLSVDQESLFIFRGSRSGAPAGAAVTLGVRVSSTLAFRHEPCPTWGLSVNLQKEAHVRRAMQCPPGAGTSLPQTELALNAAGFGFEELDTLAPIATWPPKDSNCAQDGVEPEGSRCGHTADTTLTLSAASLIQASLGFDGAAVSYTLVLMALNADSTSVIATSALIFRTEDTLSKSRAGGTSSIPPLSSLTRISLSQEVPQGKYVLRISRKNSLSSTSSESSSQESLCSPLLWRVAVSPLSVGEGTQAADGESMEQRPFVLDLDPPGLHKVPKSIAEVSVRLSFSEPLAPGRSAGGIHVCPKDSVPSDVWLQDAVKGGGGGLMSGAGGGCFAVSWMQEESKDGQELDGEAKGWEVHIGIATANMMVGTRYVLWFKGTDWPRGALSGLRLLQPPPFSFSVAAQDCSGHGTLASDGSCDCDSSRAGYLCGACDPSVAPKECDVAAVPLDDAHTGASSTSAAGSLAAATTSEAGAATQAKTSSQTKTTSPLAATHMSAGTDNEGKAGPVNLATGDAGVQDGKVKDRVKVPAVQGVVGDADDKKYSKRIRDDGAVDADSVVDLDSPKMSEQKSRTAAAKESLAPTDKKTAGAAGESSENGKAARKRHIICQLIGCGKNSAWALAGVSGKYQLDCL